MVVGVYYIQKAGNTKPSEEPDRGDTPMGFGT
jgi:hypothetical protein